MKQIKRISISAAILGLVACSGTEDPENTESKGGSDPSGSGASNAGGNSSEASGGGDASGTGGSENPSTGGDDAGTGGDDPGTGGDDPGTGGAGGMSSVDSSPVVINELRSTGEFDYIELFNPTDEDYTFEEGQWAVNDLKGHTEDGDPGIAIPGGTVLPAGGFLLIVNDEDSLPFGVPSSTLIPTATDVGFGLGKGDTALLLKDGEIFEEVKYNDDAHVDTWGRLPDGADWHNQDEALEATPGAANKLAVSVEEATPTDIVINEVVSKGREDIDFDYVELYNKSASPFTFAEGEWELRDGDLEASEVGFVIPGGTEIPGHGFLVLLTGEAAGSTRPAGTPPEALLNPTGDFGLGKDETITLSFQDAVHESVSYGDFHVNSYGRYPDGGDFIDLEAGAAPQLYASPGRKNFMTPASLYTSSSLNFTAFDAQEATLEAQGLRVFGLGASLSEDVEPEYISVSPDGSKAWVSLQENNGLAVVDLNANSITDIYPLGFKDHGLVGNELDASDKDEVSSLSTWPNLFGMYQPDGVASFNDNGTNYVITANEGDVRDWLSGLDEGPRVEDLTLSAATFPNFATLQEETQLGRLAVTTQLHDSAPSTVQNALYSFGARSFSIWNGDTGALVFDSGADLAKQAIAAGVYPDGRSDAKGSEPENVAIGMVGAKRLAFIALERADAVAVYDITNLASISFSQMLVTSGDDAPEGVLFISEAESPTGKALVVVSNEDSGNVTVYESDASGQFSFASALVLEGGAGAAEISAFDPDTNRLFVVNNGESLSAPRIEVLDLSTPSAAQLITNIDVSYYGAGVNSVAVNGGKVAAAIEAADRTQAGSVVVFDTNSYQLLGIAHVGALPDMLTFTPDGTKILTADEGEPLEDYSVDPLGTVSIVTLN